MLRRGNVLLLSLSNWQTVASYTFELPWATKPATCVQYPNRRMFASYGVVHLVPFLCGVESACVIVFFVGISCNGILSLCGNFLCHIYGRDVVMPWPHKVTLVWPTPLWYIRYYCSNWDAIRGCYWYAIRKQSNMVRTLLISGHLCITLS